MIYASFLYIHYTLFLKKNTFFLQQANIILNIFENSLILFIFLWKMKNLLLNCGLMILNTSVIIFIIDLSYFYNKIKSLKIYVYMYYLKKIYFFVAKTKN